MTHFLSKAFTLIAFLKDETCHRKVPCPSKCLFQISSSLQKKKKKERNVLSLCFTKCLYFFQSICFLELSGTYYTSAQQILYTKILSLFFGFSSTLDSPKLCHQHSLGIHNLVASHPSSCKFFQNFSLESFTP